MRRFTASGLLLFCLLVSVTTLFAQRVTVDVPKVSPSAITIDGKMTEAAWATAAKADVITSTNFNGWFNYYGRTVTEPDYPELYGRMLWAKDTLYVYIHIKDVVNDSSGLYFPANNPVDHSGKQWQGDQLFVGLSSRLGIPMGSGYNGNVFAAPEGPYHFLIMGNRVTLNDSASTGTPTEWQKWPGDTVAHPFNANAIGHYATTVDTTTGLWDVEMAIYNPDVAAGADIGFNFGGSQGSHKYAVADSNFDAYAYWDWQPNVPDQPFLTPPAVANADTSLHVPTDPGGYMLINSDLWAILHCVPGADDYARPEVKVPRVDPSMISVDGKMTESAWNGAAKADVITSTNFNGWFNYYGRTVTEPDYPELYGRMLWAKDTLYVYIHIKDVVNDSSGLYFPANNPVDHSGKQWQGDQLFVGLSSRLGIPMGSGYNGNVFAAPEGPYHFLIMGNRVTLNDSASTGTPTEWQKWPGDTVAHPFNANAIGHYATTVDTTTGLWDVEMAIYNPDVAAGADIGFNFGGSQGSHKYAVADSNFDAYAYWDWQPNVPDQPFLTPPAVANADTSLHVPTDPGGYMLINSDLWALLNFDPTLVVSSVRPIDGLTGVPVQFTLSQNYPNPFNPSTKIDFALPRSGKVSLEVYNVLGQRVASLVNSQYNAGKYQVDWNASRLASGLYFYRLTVDNNVVDTKKMLLLK